MIAAYEFDVLDRKDNTFYFITYFELAYEIQFRHTDYIFPNDPDVNSHVFELIIRLVANLTGRRTPPDPQIAATIAAIIETFLADKERIIVYICDSSDQRQVARARKFNSWFTCYKGVDLIKMDQRIGNRSGEAFLLSLIMRYDNPRKVSLFDAFERLIAGENDEKP